MFDYFFSGTEYIRVNREDTGSGTVDAGYPAPISNWHFGAFGANGIDAALYSGSKCYFFKGNQYIRVTRGTTGSGTVDAGYPAPISNWGWGAFGANGIDAALYSGSKCYFFKGNQYIRVTRGEVGPGTVDAGYPQPISNWGWGAFGANGIKAPLYSGGPVVTPPTGGAQSNNNYYLGDGGTALTGVSVTMIFDEDFVSSANGYSFQLNGYSTHGSSTQWQQFVVYISPNDTQFYARIETWNGTSASNELNRIDAPFVTLKNGKIPAGYQLTFSLQTDSGNNVNGATYTMTDNKGNQVGTKSLTILGQTLRNTGKPATQANLAPLAAMTMNIGGDYGSSTATITSALGTITYEANQLLTATNSEPSYTDFNDNTAEMANVAYGSLPQSQNTLVTHSFYQIAPLGSAPEAHALGKKRHQLPPRDEQSMGGRHALQPREEADGAR